MKQKLLKQLSLRFTMLAVMLVGAIGAWADQVTMTYSGSETSNLTAGANAAATLGLDATQWSVIADAGKANNNVGINKAGDFRLYYNAGGSNTLTVSSLTGATINSIAISFTGTSYSNVSVTANGNVVEMADDAYAINSTSFVLGNANTSNVQVRITSVVIDYTPGVTTKVATPAIYGQESFLDETEVTIACGTADATILYSTDGGQNWKNYTAPFTLSETTTVVAKATKEGLDDSEISSAKTFTKAAIMTVTEALAAIDEQGDINSAYVKGIVCYVESYSSGQLTYYISDDGTTESDQLEIFKGKGLDNQNFSSKDDLGVGDEVTVFGNLTLYNQSTYEFGPGSYLVAYKQKEVQKQDPTIVVDDAVNVDFGSTFTVDAEMIEGGTITLSSSNEAVATVNGLVITPKAVGSAIITVETAENREYNAGEAAFVFNVNAPKGLATAPAGGREVTTVFTDKALNSKEGGLVWTANIDANSFESSGNARGVQFGAGKGNFTLKANGIGIVTKIVMTVSTNANDDDNTIAVTVGDEPFICGQEEVVSMTKGNNYELTFVGEADGDIVISVSDAVKSVYFKSIVVTVAGEAKVAAKLNAKGYATLCSQYPLDFSELQDVTAWQLISIQDNKLTFDQVQKCIGGEGLLLKGEPSAEVTIPAKDCAEALADNMLEGTMAPTYVGNGEYYGLSGENFEPVKEGVVKAGKALLSTMWDEDAESVKSFTFVFNGTTGVREVRTVSAAEAAALFNIAGQRISKAQKGVNIQNGRKFIVK